jgi:predicted nuclease of predicted toxin-antitoxin system
VRFFVDANLPRAAIGALERHQHDVSFARDVGLGAALDADIAAYAQSHDSALVTRDLDFADIRRYPPEGYAGILVLRVPETTSASAIARILDLFLADQTLVTSLPGRLAILGVNSVRFRPPVSK